jgi:hypothetical protein
MENTMQITLDNDDISNLSPAMRAELSTILFRRRANPDPANVSEFEFEDVADFTPAMIEKFAERCSEKTMAGLRVFAEHGPKIRADLLKQAGIENYGQFQGAVTRRTRTVTGDPDAFMFDWDDWGEGENAERGFGHYVVTARTYSALREHFGIN